MFPSDLNRLVLDADQALAQRRERTAARDPELAWSLGYALPVAASASEPWPRRLQRRALAALRWRPGRGAVIVADAPGAVGE